MEITFLPLILLGAAVLLLAIFFYYVPFLLWISAKVSGVNISLIQLFLMRIRKVPPYIITRAMIEAHKAGIKTLTRDELEAHYLAGGHVEKVVSIHKQIKELNEKLESLRASYIKGNKAKREQLKPTILDAEEKLNNLLGQPDEWEKKARNAEIVYLRNNHK